MFTIGMRPRCRCWSTDRFGASSGSSCCSRIATRSITCSTARPESFCVGKPYAKQTWAKGLDDSGRPIRAPNTMPSLDGTRVWPSVAGGNNWYSPTYSPQTNLFYVAVREAGSVYFIGDPEYKEGEQFNGGGFRSVPGEQEWGAVTAFDPATGDKKWEHKLFSPPWAGLLSTAGNLVFGSTNEGQVFALMLRRASRSGNFKPAALRDRIRSVTRSMGSSMSLLRWATRFTCSVSDSGQLIV